ncbi:KAT8 regulatory NSL complex subunit 1 [Sergentomyia squamirostris]
MGLRRTAASVLVSVKTSSSDVAAMAPALTEPVTQSKLSSPATAASPHPDIHSSTNSSLADDHHPHNYYSVRHKQPSLDLSGVAKGSFQLAFVESVGIDTSNGLAESSPADDSTHMDQTANETSTLGDVDVGANVSTGEEVTTVEGGGDQVDQEKVTGKITQQIPSSSSTTQMGVVAKTGGDYIKENAEEIEQFMGELASSSDIDLFQVFKTFENVAQVGDGFSDLVAPFSIFGDDVISVEDVTTVKDSDTAQLRQDIEKRQHQMQRKCEFLLRRLRKLQIRFMGEHISEEVAGLFEHTNRLLKRKDQVIIDVVSTTPFTAPSASVPPEIPPQDMKPLSQGTLRSYIKRIENVALTQNSMAQKRSVGVVTLPGGKGSPAIGSLLPPLDEKSRTQLELTSGLLNTELRAAESAMDSDATATSSGGESADELINYSNSTQQTLSIAKRAAWRWSKDRAAIATRWSWLLAQISDLEYRIRQHNDLQNQIRKSKGAVSLEEPPPQQSVNGYRGVLPGNSKAVAESEDGSTPNGAYDQQSGSASRTRPFQRSGFKKRKLLQTANLHTISKKAARSSTIKCGCQWPVHPCALCTGRQDPTAPRDLPDMMPVSERVALLDPCYHPVLSFPEDVPQNIHFESVMRIPEWQVKVVRCTTKAPVKTMTTLSTSTKAKMLPEDRVKQSKHRMYEEPSRKAIGRKFSQGLVSNKIRKAKARRALQGKYSQLLKHHKNNRKVAGTKPSSTSGSDTAGLQHDMENGLPRSKNSSPTLNSSSYKHERSGYSDLRRNRNSYDIDNIVIPYSVAAATRVEILPYKEIPTPKWKVVNEKDFTGEIESESSQMDANVESEETLGETIAQIHERSLLDERKKFSTFLKFPYSTRSRANRRIDSRAESSGANTPDPTSPSVAVDQESIPSPACPSTPLTPLEHVDGGDTISTPTVPIANPLSSSTLIRSERRRTISLKLLSKDRDVAGGSGGGSVSLASGGCGGGSSSASMDRDMRRSSTPDLKETIPPYEPLVFPLPDDVYEVMLRTMPSEHLVKKECMGAKRLAQQHQQLCKASSTRGASSSIARVHFAENDSSLMDNMLDIDSDAETDSAMSATAEEDPNDPEWFETHE